MTQTQPSYILTRTSRRTIGLRVSDDGTVMVSAPYIVPRFVISQFVASKQDWIDTVKKSMLQKSPAKKMIYRHGSTIHIAGTQYRLHMTEGNAIVLVGLRILFPKKFLPRASFHMELWCRAYAKKLLTERVDAFAQIMQVTYKKISIRNTSSRWGSCSSSGAISFSYRLVLAQPQIIDYVVIHELAHITHHHHAKAFWDRVGEFYSDYVRARTWLRKNGHSLTI